MLNIKKLNEPYKMILSNLAYYGRLICDYSKKQEEKIDIVYLWVDGDDPEHKKKKGEVLSGKMSNVEKKSVMEYRWENNNEILLSLKSLEKYCPWVSKVWIITDNQTPKLSNISEDFRNKIQIVDHKEVFKGYENALPTFNSRTIETFIWRIDELADNFVFFNDDMFVLKELSKKDFFILNEPVIRGNNKIYNKNKKVGIHTEGMINSARAIGFNGSFFRSGHCPYTLKKSALENLFISSKDLFEKNISYRFRDRKQFKVVSLLYHQLLKEKKCSIKPGKDYIHISQDICSSYSREKLLVILKKIKNKKYKFLCINDLGALIEKVPEYKDYLPLEITEKMIN